MEGDDLMFGFYYDYFYRGNVITTVPNVDNFHKLLGIYKLKKFILK